MDNLKKSTNTPRKEKDLSLSLFRIPLNFFASEEDLDKFHENLEKLKEKVFIKEMAKLEAKKMRKLIMKKSTPKPFSRKFTYKGPSTLSTLKKSLSGGTNTNKNQITYVDSDNTNKPPSSTTSTLESSTKQKSNDNLDTNLSTKTEEEANNNSVDNNDSMSQDSNSQNANTDVPTLENTELDTENKNEVLDNVTSEDVELENDNNNSITESEDNDGKGEKDEDKKDKNDEDEKDEDKKDEDEKDKDQKDDDNKNEDEKDKDRKDDDNKDEHEKNKDQKDDDNKSKDEKDKDQKDDDNKSKDENDKDQKDDNNKSKDENDKDKKDTDKKNENKEAKNTKDSDDIKNKKPDSANKAADATDKADKVGDAADKADKVGDAADKAGKVADTADKAGQVADAAGNAAGGTVPGVGDAKRFVNDAGNIGKAVLNGNEDDLPKYLGQGVVDGARTAAKALDGLAPGAGQAASAAIGAVDSTLGQTEAGKSAKKKIGWCCSTGCIYSLILDLIILMLPLLLMHNVLDTAKQIIDSVTNGIVDFFTGEDEEEKNTNFVFALEEGTLNQKNKSIYTILDDTLEKIKYKEYKEALNNPDKTVQDVKPNASTYILPMITANYSLGNLKEPTLASAPDDFPDEDDNRMGNTYYSMESKHMPLFQDVLDNRKEGTYSTLSDSEQEKATKLKNLFNYDKKMIEFIDGLTEKLDTTYNIFNPYENTYENNVSLRDLLDELSTQEGDANYHIRTVKLIFNDRTNNLELIEDFYTFQEEMGMLELMVYMQSYRQYQSAISDLRQKAVNGDFVLPDVYHTEEFFEQFSTITDVASYITLAQTTYTPSIAYEIACETINIWKDPPEISEKSYNGKTFAYIPVLETWYANYNFSLITVGEKAILKCDGYESRQIDENSWDNSSNLLKRYNIHDKEKFFELYKRATGTNPVEGEDNIYTPYGLDENWELDVDIETGSTKATSNAVAYSYATTEYLTENGGSIPLATNLLIVTQDFLEPYSQTTVDKFNLTHSEHRGIDYSVPSGTPILAMRDGTITKATYNNAYGYYVEITDSNGYKSKYAHGNGTFNVSVGQKVTSGTQIMESGNSGNSTGPHLHVEVHDASGNLVNPNVYAGLTL